jgi:hypothetical protein
MGKRYYFLHGKIIHPFNLWAAYKQAARGKRYKPTAAHFEYDLTLAHAAVLGGGFSVNPAPRTALVARLLLRGLCHFFFHAVIQIL